MDANHDIYEVYNVYKSVGRRIGKKKKNETGEFDYMEIFERCRVWQEVYFTNSSPDYQYLNVLLVRER